MPAIRRSLNLLRVAELIHQQFAVRYEPSHVWKVLTSLGWSCQTGAPRGETRRTGHRTLETGTSQRRSIGHGGAGASGGGTRECLSDVGTPGVEFRCIRGKIMRAQTRISSFYPRGGGVQRTRRGPNSGPRHHDGSCDLLGAPRDWRSVVEAPFSCWGRARACRPWPVRSGRL
jgi:hypothetical protein